MADDDIEADEDEDPVPVETINLTDPKSVRRARDRSRRTEQEEASFWRAVFNDKVGRRVMWELLTQDCGGFSPPFACGPNGFPQPEATWFAAGKYAIGQRLYQRWMQLAREGLLAMTDEHDPRFRQTKKTRNRGVLE